MTRYIYSPTIPEEVKFFTPGKRYEILAVYNQSSHGPHQFQADVMGDDGKIHRHINVGWPCAFLDGESWTLVEEETNV